MTLSTVTAQNGNTGTFQGVNGNANANTGEEIKTSIAAKDGDSGGVATVVAGNNTTYAVGILSSSDQSGQNARFTTINDIAYTEANAALGQGIDPNTMPTDLILGAAANEYIRGSYRKADIITNGDNDVILAGSGGGLINTGTGRNDVVFLPGANGQTDAGTTVVVGPGTTTLVGGGANDKLVLLADRLQLASGAETLAPSDTSDTIQLLGGYSYYPNSTDPTAASKIYQLSTSIYSSNSNTIVGNNGLYSYRAFYKLVGNNLTIIVSSADLTGDINWDGSVTIKNFKSGDFGISLTDGPIGGDNSNAAYTNATNAAYQRLTASSTASHYIDDDSSVTWDGQKPYKYGVQPYEFGYPSITVEDSEISADLAAVIANTQGDGTTLAEPPPPSGGNQTFAGSGVTGSIGAGYVATVTGSNDTITAAGANATIDFGATGETGNISAGTVALWDGASAVVSGNNNTINLNARGILALLGSGNIVDIAAAGNAVYASGATLNLWNNAAATVTGNNDVINLNAGNVLSVSGQTNRVTVAAAGNTVSIASGEVDLWNNAGAILTGDGDAIVLNSGDTLSSIGANASLTINGSGNVVTLSGQNASATVGSTGNSLSVAGGTISFFNGSGGTVTGAGNRLTLYNNVTASAAGSGDTASIAGTGDTLAIAGGTVSLWSGAAATVNGNGDTLTLYDGASLLAGGTGDVVFGAGTGLHISVGSAMIGFYNGAGGTVTGSHDDLILNNTDHVTATGSATTATIQGTGDTLAVGSAAIGLADRSSATVTGNNNGFQFYGGSVLDAFGTNESFVFSSQPASSTINHYDASDTVQFSRSTFANWQALLGQASQSGADTIIHTDSTHSLTLTNIALTSLSQTHFQFV